jgi:hypothetical protein
MSEKPQDRAGGTARYFLIGAVVGTALLVFLYWLAGFPLERAPGLAESVILGLTLGAILGGLYGEVLRQEENDE